MSHSHLPVLFLLTVYSSVKYQLLGRKEGRRGRKIEASEQMLRSSTPGGNFEEAEFILPPRSHPSREQFLNCSLSSIFFSVFPRDEARGLQLKTKNCNFSACFTTVLCMLRQESLLI